MAVAVAVGVAVGGTVALGTVVATRVGGAVAFTCAISATGTGGGLPQAVMNNVSSVSAKPVSFMAALPWLEDFRSFIRKTSEVWVPRRDALSCQPRLKVV